MQKSLDSLMRRRRAEESSAAEGLPKESELVKKWREIAATCLALVERTTQYLQASEELENEADELIAKVRILSRKEGDLREVIQEAKEELKKVEEIFTRLLEQKKELAQAVRANQKEYNELYQSAEFINRAVAHVPYPREVGGALRPQLGRNTMGGMHGI